MAHAALMSIAPFARRVVGFLVVPRDVVKATSEPPTRQLYHFGWFVFPFVKIFYVSPDSFFLTGF